MSTPDAARINPKLAMHLRMRVSLRFLMKLRAVLGEYKTFTVKNIQPISLLMKRYNVHGRKVIKTAQLFSYT